ncbi:MAG: 3-deoxy-7-phosphoheptulonate synthase [Clostridiales Family XIII bacterium]|jgi:3-deoxy-7-phosphoheptulonate synthase|nr:3-deoxy-7-phosphoheptulonate synthase [Clostridiales Family XIII bacterium]
MIIVFNKSVKEEQIKSLKKMLKEKGIRIKGISSDEKIVIGLIGDTSSLSEESLMRNEFVENVMKVSEPYKLAGKRFSSKPTVVKLNKNTKIGGEHFAVFAGPCSIESESQILSIAKAVKRAGASALRGGAFKPRTSPYAFQGLGVNGLELLEIAREKTGLPIVTEIISIADIPTFEEKVDIIQIGARNMQNFQLLREVGEIDKPVLLKRGLSNTIEELLMAAEYLLYGGKAKVILCERGIRTFESATRNTLDLSAIPVLRKKTHLPVVVDPSHGTGYWDLVPPMALAATAAGADGLIIEVHNQPEVALCDGQQSLTPELFSKLMKQIKKIREVL